jgi:hypothetical protein
MCSGLWAQRIALVDYAAGEFAIITKEQMLGRFGPASETDVGDPAPIPEAADRVVIDITIPRPLEVLGEEDVAALEEFLRHRRVNFVIRRVDRIREGCSTLRVEVSGEEAARLLAAFRAGELGTTQIIDVGPPRALSSATVSAPAPSGKFLFSASFRMAIRKARLARPWYRLRYLLTNSGATAHAAHIVSASDQRAYAAPRIRDRWRQLRADLVATLFLWPLLGIALASLTLLPFSGAVVPIGLLAGFFLSWFGAQPCSSLISPLACGAGTLVMGFAFSVVQAVSLRVLDNGVLSATTIRHDPFVSVVGGIIGLTAPAWRQRISMPLIVILISIVALSIAYSGWLMAQPGRARRRYDRFSQRKVIVGSLLGALAGGGIGAIFGLTRALGAGVTSFVVAFSSVGALWMFGSTAIRTRNWRRGVVVSILHTIVGALLVTTAFSAAGTTVGLMALAASTGFFHSTFFTAAFVVGERLGGYRAAFVAAALEGAVGFTAFVVSQML